MKTEKRISNEILKITLIIKEHYPELSKYTMEMPMTIPTSKNPKINSKSLQDYYDSLKDLLENYIENQVLK